VLKVRGRGQPKSELVRLLSWLDRTKRVAALFACALIVAAGALQKVAPWFLPYAVVLYLISITSLLLEIHGHTTQEETIYGSHQEAGPAFFDEIRAAVERQGRCDIAWIGVTMQSAWLTIENALGRVIADGTRSDLHIRLLQADPEYMAMILEADDSCPQLTREQWEHICRFGRRNKDSLRASHSSVEIAQYAYMPNYHGLLINGELLFLSTVRWTGRGFTELSVPHEPFQRFDHSTERGRYMIQLYQAWLQKGYQAAVRISVFPESDIPSGADDSPMQLPPKVPAP